MDAGGELKSARGTAVRRVVARMGPLAHIFFSGGFCAATLVACLLLFQSLKRENAELRRRAQSDQDALQQTLSSFRLALAKLEAAQVERDVVAVPVPVPAAGPPLESMNINKRSQVLRLYRRGESAEHIASALHLPRTEVDLLLKVHRTVISQL